MPHFSAVAGLYSPTCVYFSFKKFPKIEAHMTTFDDVAEKIRDRRCVLFLGAGCSMESRAPSGSSLYELVIQQFVGNNSLAHDLTTAFDFACGRDEVNRHKFEGFTWDLLTNLKPNIGHELLRQFRWPAIFTTNYDSLLEDTYGHHERSQQLYTIYRPEGSEIEFNNPEILPFFKLFGCISGIMRPRGEGSRPLVLTSSDFAGLRRELEWMLEALMRLKSANTWLFMGYSFADGLITNLLTDLKGTSS